jgi:hypothetical protein
MDFPVFGKVAAEAPKAKAFSGGPGGAGENLTGKDMIK